MPLFDDASSSLHNLDLLSTSRVYSGLLHAFIADPHTPLYLIKSLTHIRVAQKKKSGSPVTEVEFWSKFISGPFKEGGAWCEALLGIKPFHGH